MTPVQFNVFAELLPAFTQAARTGAWWGVSLGGLVGVLLALWLVRGGWLGAKRTAVQILCALWMVGAGLVFGWLLGGSVGVASGAAPAIAESPVGRGVLRDLGGQAADVIVGTVALAQSRGLVEVPADAPPALELLAGFRRGGEVPVATVRATAAALPSALKASGGAAFGRDLASALSMVVDEAWAGTAAAGVTASVQELLAGGDPTKADPSVGDAWSRLDEAAAQSGASDALSRLELSELVAERVIVPVIARLVQGPMILAALVVFVCLMIAWSLPPLGYGIAARLSDRKT